MRLQERMPRENSIPLIGLDRPSFASEKVMLGDKKEAKECYRRLYEYRDSQGGLVAQGIVDVNTKPSLIESPDQALGYYHGWKLESFVIVTGEGKQFDIIKHLGESGHPVPEIVIDDLVEQCGYFNEHKKMIVVPPLKSVKEIQELLHENVHARQDYDSRFKPLLDLYELSETDVESLGEDQVRKHLENIILAVSGFKEANKYAGQLSGDIFFFEKTLRSGKVPAAEISKLKLQRLEQIQKLFALPMQICEIDAEHESIKGLKKIKEKTGADFLAPFVWAPSKIADTPHSRALTTEEENRYEILGAADLYERKKKFEHGKPSVTSAEALAKMYLESVGALPTPWEKG